MMVGALGLQPLFDAVEGNTLGQHQDQLSPKDVPGGQGP
jgi:hypothetical protein